MRDSFPKALKLVLVHEGGFSNHPKDPGGATMKGVIQRVYDGYRIRKGETTRSVKQITNEELLDIYRQLYWNKIDGDDLPAGIDYCTFDAAVNSGVHQAGKWLQRALNDVLKARLAVDGNIGPATLAVAAAAPLAATVDAMCNRRLAMLKGLKTWPTFGTGWSRRVKAVQTDAKKF